MHVGFSVVCKALIAGYQTDLFFICSQTVPRVKKRGSDGAVVVEGNTGDVSVVFPEKCLQVGAYVWISRFGFTHVTHCIDRVCMQVGFCISTCTHSAWDHGQPITEEICMQCISQCKQCDRQHPEFSFLIGILTSSFDCPCHPPLYLWHFFYQVHTTVKQRAT